MSSEKIMSTIAPHSQPKVSVIVVTYNSSKDISACLQSIIDQKGLGIELIIIDNNSSDATNQVISQFFMQLTNLLSDQAVPMTTVIQNQKNIGFSLAVNQAAKLAKGEYIYLLNPDAKLLKSNDLASLLRYAQENPKYGVIGSKVIDSDGVESKPQYSYPGEKSVGFDSSQLPGKLAWVIGASMLMPKVLFDQLDGLIQESFLYADDIDICLRARQAGYEVGYFPEVVVEHIGSASADQLPSYDKKVLKTKAKYLFCQKHYTQAQFKQLLQRDKARAEKRCRTAAIFGLLMPSLKKKLPVYQAVRDVAGELLLEQN